MDAILVRDLLPAILGLLSLAAIAWATPFRRRTGTLPHVTPTGAAASSKEQP